MPALLSTGPSEGRLVRRALRAIGAAFALATPIAACDFGGDARNCLYGEAVETCAARVLGEGAAVAETDAFFARRGFRKDPRVSPAGEGATHVYARDESGGARTVFMVAHVDSQGALVRVERAERRN